jgi:tetratricopeptide (TPR) repeat protein
MPKSNLTPEERERWRKLHAQLKEGEFSAALEGLRSLAQDRPDLGMLAAVYANALKASGNLAEAEIYFRRGVDVCPRTELASLGLFHCLWELNKRTEAVVEMQRFMSIGTSADYSEIAQEVEIQKIAKAIA